MTVLAEECMHFLKVAIKKFGEYTFFDKGPDEVMNIHAMAKNFRSVSPDHAVETFKDILKDENYGRKLVSAILVHLQDWDELWDKHGEFCGKYL
jgi:hypothetical protein